MNQLWMSVAEDKNGKMFTKVNLAIEKHLRSKKF